MISTITEFKLQNPMTPEEAKTLFLSTAPRYQQAEGLIRKNYLLTEDGGTVCGVYLWHNREDAEAMFTQEWYEFVKSRYGSEPTVTYFSTPVVVDNLSKEIITA